MAGPLFREGGVFSKTPVDGLEMLAWNAVGLGSIVAWNSICSLILFGSLKQVGLLRVTEAQEVMGLDKAKHNELSYPECELMTLEPFIRRNMCNTQVLKFLFQL